MPLLCYGDLDIRAPTNHTRQRCSGTSNPGWPTKLGPEAHIRRLPPGAPHVRLVNRSMTRPHAVPTLLDSGQHFFREVRGVGLAVIPLGELLPMPPQSTSRLRERCVSGRAGSSQPGVDPATGRVMLTCRFGTTRHRASRAGRVSVRLVKRRSSVRIRQGAHLLTPDELQVWLSVGSIVGLGQLVRGRLRERTAQESPVAALTSWIYATTRAQA